MNISPADRQKYTNIFNTSNPINGKVSGQQASQIFSQSNLPKPKLAEIWNLSDLDKDGQLDLDEFVLAMHLIFASLNGSLPQLPQTLPPSLLPPSKSSNFGLKPNLALPAPANMSSAPTGSKAIKYDWHIPSHDRTAYDLIFTRFSSNPMAYITYHQTQSYFMSKGLSLPDVQQAWNLVDVQKSGAIHKDQFAMVLHMLNWKSKSIAIPPTLPIHLQNQYRNGPRDTQSPYQNNPSQLAMGSTTSSPGFGQRQPPVKQDLLDFDAPSMTQSSIPPIQPTNTYQSSPSYNNTNTNNNNNTNLFSNVPRTNQTSNSYNQNPQHQSSGPSAAEVEAVQRELKQVEEELAKSESDQLITNTVEDFQSLENFLNQLIQLTKYQPTNGGNNANEEKLQDLKYLQQAIETKYHQLELTVKNQSKELEELNLKISDLKYLS